MSEAIAKAAGMIGNLLRWIVLLLLAIVALYVLVKVAIAVGRNTEALRAWAAMLQRRLNHWIDSLREWLTRLALWSSRRPAADETLAAGEPLAIPFRSLVELRGAGDAEAVRWCYQNLMLLAARLGCPRPPDTTSVEYFRNLPAPLQPVREEVARLTELYNRTTYGEQKLGLAQRKQLEQIYQRLAGFTDQAVQFH